MEVQIFANICCSYVVFYEISLYFVWLVSSASFVKQICENYS